MSVRFLKHGKEKAVLKDNAQEPEGFKYIEGNDLPGDTVIPSGVNSIEELDGEVKE